MRYELIVMLCADKYKVNNALLFRKEDINSCTAGKCFKSIDIC